MPPWKMAQQAEPELLPERMQKQPSAALVLVVARQQALAAREPEPARRRLHCRLYLTDLD